MSEDNRRAKFYRLTVLREDAQAVWTFASVERLGRDVRFAFRALRRTPGFTAAAVVTMALGIGSSVGLFAIVNAVLLQPLPFADQDRLVLMWERNESSNNLHIEVSLPNFEDWRAQAASFESMAALGSTTWGEVEVQQDPPVRLTVSAVSASFFDTLGTRSALGRTFLPEEDEPESARVMVLSHAAWRDYFAMDPDVVGTTVPVGADREPYTIVGVMPPAFQFPRGAQMWTPLGPQLARIFRQNDMDVGAQRGLGVLYVLGRLAPDVTGSEAETELNVIIPAVWESNLSRGSTRRLVMTPLAAYIFGDARLALLGLLGGVALLLLITASNVTGLMVVRSQARTRETAIHYALGITRSRLLTTQLIECVLITGLAAVCGLGLARIALPAVVTLGPGNLPRLDEVTINRLAVVLAGLLALASGLGMTFVISLQSGRVRVAEWLKAGTPGATAGRARTRARSVLIVAEVAMALVLVVTAGLLTSSYVNLLREDLGYRQAGALTIEVTPRDGAYSDTVRRRLAYQNVLTAVRRLPGVEAAGAVFLLPFQAGVVGVDGGLLLEGESRDGPQLESRPSVAIQSISPGYFDAMGIGVVAGRVFTERDTTSAPGAVVVSESLARFLWPADDPLGQRLIAIGAEMGSSEEPVWQTVVGVVQDARYREIERGRFDLYVPYTQVPMNVANLVVRTTGDPASLAGPIRDEIRRRDPSLVVGNAATLDSIVATVMQPWRFNMTVSGLFAILALLLSAIGLFGTVAYSVADRTREIGLRRALGAQTGEVLRVVSRQAVILTLFGVGIGLVVSLAANKLIEPLLFGVAPTDPSAIFSLTAVFLLVALSASFLAAGRATRIDPIVALQAE